MKKALKLASVMCVAMLMMVLVACGSSGSSSDVGTAKDGNEVSIESAAMKLVAGVEEGGYELVDTETMKSWVDGGEDMVVIDTMPADSFASQRIPGAVNAEMPMTMEEVTDEQRDAFVAALGGDKDKKVVIYCGFVGCQRSHVGAMVAKEEGYKTVVRYPGGIIAWTDAEYEVEADE